MKYNDNELKQYLKFAKKISKKAGKIMLKYFDSENKQTYKEDETIVTIADKEINELLIKEVKKSYPNHSVLGEEKSFGKSKCIWVCDPIDGTAMYAKSIPVAVFSLALVIDGIPVIGIVNDPFTNKVYHAVKNNGAFKNNLRISVNNNKINDKESIGNFDMWPKSDINIYPAIEEIGTQTYLVSLGSIIRSSLLVADGKFTFAIFPGTKNKNCDIAAIKIIVEEAGGKVTNLLGKEQRYDQDIQGAIISNNVFHNPLVEIIKNKIKL